MQAYPYVIANVFAKSHFGGNPLAVFPEADELSQDTMQLIARQFNLSETVFVQQAKTQSAVRKLKIFTPDYEMPFAGHPTIGAAAVLHQWLNLPKHYQLETEAGLVEIIHQNEHITFGLRNPISLTLSPIQPTAMAEMLGLAPENLVGEVVNVNTGTEQTLVQLVSEQAVKTCKINTALFLSHFHNRSLYLWHEAEDKVTSRLFFPQQGAVLEDPGTGSAAANLGGWAIKNHRIPLDWQIFQGDVINRPNRLSLKVDKDKTIWVGGKVIEVASGKFFLPEDATE
ncbi:PhzF family phenazine biosynthesis protein [Avibacterium paragallinarum]|uniref:PhzF family phenazine biosynthesis protein n=1 Tax=Avibacterium paragallinarum TaxID=728 RepID=UPI00021AD514|nr:PhzF family phenazine biosynthesis protein [Avibacterium paragallinarum]QIR12439.1 PhzF family phenazine biosynthesis protein [Avibacterium paragallinarum]QJE10607.1 PhzF family phenazine biosynthesis protein [Avibacterium paragallinarum]QJE12801.1 PhzF family phenazine biosynthesis protein [Avibacterium paragallinarum]QJE15002.1 PhzF family phenazine biosynthesis protein [Avibacterium paragallinarum]QJE17202.1 PhzF family phenazine biosynthesis protein [Avibacterium paragallinarum]